MANRGRSTSSPPSLLGSRAVTPAPRGRASRSLTSSPEPTPRGEAGPSGEEETVPAPDQPQPGPAQPPFAPSGQPYPGPYQQYPDQPYPGPVHFVPNGQPYPGPFQPHFPPYGQPYPYPGPFQPYPGPFQPYPGPFQQYPGPVRPHPVPIPPHSLTVSWPKPGRTAVLCYGNVVMADDVRCQINAASRRQKTGVIATLSTEPGPGEPARRPRVAFEVMVTGLADDGHLRRLLNMMKLPARSIRNVGYHCEVGETISAVSEMLSGYGHLVSFETRDDSTGSRLQATAYFRYAVDASKAAEELDGKPLPFNPEGRMRVRLNSN